jgi:DNA repair ATPase RecN
MAGVAEIPKFEEMVAAVSRFISEVSEACNEMAAAGNECVEQCDNDEPSTKSNAKLTNCIKKFNESLETAEQVKKGLQQELERLYEIKRMSDELDYD